MRTPLLLYARYWCTEAFAVKCQPCGLAFEVGFCDIELEGDWWAM